MSFMDGIQGYGEFVGGFTHEHYEHDFEKGYSYSQELRGTPGKDCRARRNRLKYEEKEAFRLGGQQALDALITERRLVKEGEIEHAFQLELLKKMGPHAKRPPVPARPTSMVRPSGPVCPFVPRYVHPPVRIVHLHKQELA